MNIRVEKQSGERFLVTVEEGRGQTRHQVTVRPEHAQKLTAGRVAVEQLVEQSFRFLLEREPKEDILPEFDLAVIARYFPEYESEIRKKLQQAAP